MNFYTAVYWYICVTCINFFVKLWVWHIGSWGIMQCVIIPWKWPLVLPIMYTFFLFCQWYIWTLKSVLYDARVSPSTRGSCSVEATIASVPSTLTRIIRTWYSEELSVFLLGCATNSCPAAVSFICCWLRVQKTRQVWAGVGLGLGKECRKKVVYWEWIWIIVNFRFSRYCNCIQPLPESLAQYLSLGGICRRKWFSWFSNMAICAYSKETECGLHVCVKTWMYSRCIRLHEQQSLWNGDYKPLFIYH